jgi:hypothetical protein
MRLFKRGSNKRVTINPVYEALGDNDKARQEKYKEYVSILLPINKKSGFTNLW